MQKWVCSHLCVGSLESTPSPFLVSSLQGEAGTVSEIDVQEKHLPLFVLIRTSNFTAWAIGLDLSCSISIKSVWDHQLGNAANQSGNEIFVLVWHWHYTCPLRWIPGVHCSLFMKACCHQEWSYQLYWFFLFDTKSTLISEKILKKKSVKTQ